MLLKARTDFLKAVRQIIEPTVEFKQKNGGANSPKQSWSALRARQPAMEPADRQLGKNECKNIISK